METKADRNRLFPSKGGGRQESKPFISIIVIDNSAATFAFSLTGVHRVVVRRL